MYPVAGAPPAAQLQAELDRPRLGPRAWLNEHPFVAYALRRFLLFLVTLWGALTVSFFFFRMIPGDPIQAFIATMEQNQAYGTEVGKETIEHYRRVFGLEGNLFQQYLAYLYQIVVTQDLGPSLLNFPTPAQVGIMRALPWTIGLLGLSVIFAWILGVIVGGIAAWRRNTGLAEVVTNFAVTFSHIPSYFIALIVLYLLAFRLGWFPSSAGYDPHYTPGLNLDFIMSVIRHGSLPAFALIFVRFCGDMLATRMLTITTLGEDYLTYADAKGLPPRQILTQYALRNCFLPQLTSVAIQLGSIFSGTVILERVFNYPGMGNLLIQAIGQLDYNTIQGIVAFSIVGVLLANFIIDLMLPFIDPRIKYGD
jgi:peptide/nickel transport system permease protein